MTIYPGADISYRPSEHLTLHASYNTSLRMPSFTEMYYKLQGYSADPHLKPEEMQAVELGANGQWSMFNVQCALWYHHGKNMIDWIMDTSKGDEAVWQSVNHTKINSVGFERPSHSNLALYQRIRFFTLHYSLFTIVISIRIRSRRQTSYRSMHWSICAISSWQMPDCPL